MGQLKHTYIKWIIVIITTCGVILFVLFPVINIVSISYSIALNFILMIWMSIVETLLKLKLKSSYFNSHPIEDEGRIYKYFGVHLFRKLLVLSG